MDTEGPVQVGVSDCEGDGNAVTATGAIRLIWISPEPEPVGCGSYERDRVGGWHDAC